MSLLKLNHVCKDLAHSCLLAVAATVYSGNRNERDVNLLEETKTQTFLQKKMVMWGKAN